MARTVQFTALDALRGVAAIAVARFHFSPSWAGYLAVDFFFVLSGFILSHGYLYGRRQVGGWEFLVHRLARLYPLHLYALLVYVALACLLDRAWPTYPDGALFAFVQHITLLNNVGFNPHGLTYNEPSWSISVEFVVNMLFIACVTTGTRSVVLMLVALSGLGLIAGLTGHLDVSYENYFTVVNAGLVRCLASFSLGILTYRLYLRWQGVQGARRVWSIAEVVVLAVLVVLLFGRSGKTSALDFAMPFLFMGVILVFALERGWVAEQLGRLAYFGKISYSLYLNQFAVLFLVRHFLPGRSVPLTLTVFLAVLWAYSHFTYRWLEQPARLAVRGRLERLFSISNRGKQD
jgi:peptidoglycan/LPS O-acetylase OafA/YrhL